MTNALPPRRSPEADTKLHKAVLKDLHWGSLKRSLRQDLKDIYYFYLDDDRRRSLSKMGRVKRWLHVAYWLLKNMILKLTPTRRLLSLLGILLSVAGFPGGQRIYLILGFLMLLVVLMLELKDKLLAQDELAAGHAVQEALMPDCKPSFAGWDIWLISRPANQVGGDFVDYLPVRTDLLGVALGDVAGKGLGAALFMAKLQATLRALAPTASSLTHLGEQLNRIFCRDCLPHLFASLVYLELQPDSGVVRLLNAGHIPPIVLQGSSTAELPRGTPALGLMPDTRFKEQRKKLLPGDWMLIYSDGLVEAQNERGAFYGKERLLAVAKQLGDLSAEAAGGLLLHEVRRFAGSAQPSDDISMVLLKRVGE